MPPPRLKARFFADESGTILIKERPLSDKVKYAIYDRDGGRCVLCRVNVVRHGKFGPLKPDVSAVDHIVPRARGGRNTTDNLRLLCLTCNASKGAR